MPTGKCWPHAAGFLSPDRSLPFQVEDRHPPGVIGPSPSFANDRLEDVSSWMTTGDLRFNSM
jgi:hypothetical protein